jgi:hypothetical protein
MALVLVELQDSAIVHRNNQLFGVDSNEPMRVLEAKPGRRV